MNNIQSLRPCLYEWTPVQRPTTLVDYCTPAPSRTCVYLQVFASLTLEGDVMRFPYRTGPRCEDHYGVMNRLEQGCVSV